jgi:hypothetical protein
MFPPVYCTLHYKRECCMNFSSCRMPISMSILSVTTRAHKKKNSAVRLRSRHYYKGSTSLVDLSVGSGLPTPMSALVAPLELDIRPGQGLGWGPGSFDVGSDSSRFFSGRHQRLQTLAVSPRRARARRRRMPSTSHYLGISFAFDDQGAPRAPDGRTPGHAASISQLAHKKTSAR